MIKILKHFTKQDYIGLLLVLGFVVLGVWCDLSMPDYMAKINQLLVTGQASVHDVLVNGGYMISYCLGSFASAVVVSLIGARIGANLSKNLRSHMFEKVSSFSMEDINKFSIPSLITRSTNDVTQIQMSLIMAIQVMIKSPILAVWAIIKISGKNYQWTLATGIVILVMLTFISVIMGLVVPKFKVIQKLTDNLNGATRETLSGIRVVRAYNAEQYQEVKFDKANEDITKNHLFVSRAFAFMNPFMTAMMSSINLIIYWIGAILINNLGPLVDKGADISSPDVQSVIQARVIERSETFANMTAFGSYAVQVIMAFMMLTMIFMILPRAQVSAKRLNEVFDLENSIKDGSYTSDDRESTGSIVFENVEYKYPDAEEAILENINLNIKKGQTVAIIGGTGSGKSTLINLIPRFADVTGGRILIDGVDVKEYKEEFLHNKISFIPQKAVLFSGTIRSNVLYGETINKEYTEQDLVDAIKIAQAEEFVLSKEDTYDAVVEQNGLNFSGGQKQRIAIARAVARHPEIIIFDDSFSALDYKTDKILRQELNEKLADTTKIIVAQRIGTIKEADQIVVLDEGKIVGIGTHKELLNNCDVYLDIAKSQFSEEEINNER